MSQYYKLGKETLWNPSNGASAKFLRHAALTEGELGLPSGIGPMENDEARIDPAVFGRFVDALLARHRDTRHGVMRALGEGFTATALVLAERAGLEPDWSAPASDGMLRDVQVPWPQEDAWEVPLREKVREMSRHMPR